MKAIIDEKLESVLTKLGVWDDICEHRVYCAKCSRVINPENIGIIIPRRTEEGERIFDFYCDNPECIDEILNVK